MNIQIPSKLILVGLLSVISLLLFAHLVGVISKFYFGHGYLLGLIPLFNVDTEGNIPTLYSSFAIMVCALLLAFIALLHKTQKYSYAPWVGLSIIFLFLSIDEGVSLHERLIVPTREILDTSGALYFAWVIPYGALLLIFVIVYSKFLLNLPKKIRNLFIISGGTFVTGAIGFELISGNYMDLYGGENLTYALLTTCEETLEMLGIAMFIYTLLEYISVKFQSVTLSFKA